MIVKGIMTSEDARMSIEHGAAGIIVSNHGGRQLDTVSSTVCKVVTTYIYIQSLDDETTTLN